MNGVYLNSINHYRGPADSNPSEMDLALGETQQKDCSPIPENEPWNKIISYLPGVGSITSTLFSNSLEKCYKNVHNSPYRLKNFQRLERLSHTRNEYRKIDTARWVLTAAVIAALGYYIFATVALLLAGGHFHEYEMHKSDSYKNKIGGIQTPANSSNRNSFISVDEKERNSSGNTSGDNSPRIEITRDNDSSGDEHKEINDAY